MATTVSSRKAKGRRLQDETAQRIREHIRSQTGLAVDDEDVRVAIMGEKGTDIKLSPLAKKYFPYDVECKNVEKISLWACLKQAEANTGEGRKPMLVVKRNRTPAYVIVRADDYFQKT
jgi:hypothetical protein